MPINTKQINKENILLFLFEWYLVCVFRKWG